MTLTSVLIAVGRIVLGGVVGVGACYAAVRATPHAREALLLYRATPVSVDELTTAESSSGTPTAGERTAGEPTTGKPPTGEPTVGAPPADEGSDAEPTAGGVSVGDTVTVEGWGAPLVEKRVAVPGHGRRAIVGTSLVQRRQRYELGPVSHERWRTVDGTLASVPFAIDDGEELIEVEPPDAEDFGSFRRFAAAVGIDRDEDWTGTVRPLRYVRESGGEVETLSVAGPADDAVAAGEFDRDGRPAAATDRRLVTDGGGRCRRGALRPGEDVYVVATLTERFGNRYLTGQEQPGEFRLVRGERPSAREPARVAALWGLGAVAAVAVAIAIVLPVL